MDNRHKKIKGYRELSQEEINAMNNIKAYGEDLRWLVGELKTIYDIDQRWVSIAETHLQQGIMAAVRSVAKPDSF